MVAHSWRYVEPRAGAHSFFPVCLCNLSKGPSYSPFRLSTPFCFQHLENKLLRKQIRFFDSLTAALSTNHVSLHLVNKSGPPDPPHPCKSQSFVKAWSRFRAPGPRLSLSVSAILSGAPAFRPHFVLSRSSQPRRRGNESKTKALGAHQSQPLPSGRVW